MSDLKNDSSQAERRRVLANDRQQTSTFLDHVEPSAGGRFAQLAESKSIISGAGPSMHYPAGPEWTSNGAGVGVEPPLGFDVNAMEAVVTAAEIEASLAEAAAPTSAAASPVAVVETTSANRKKRKL